jgi:cell division protein FtsW
VSTEFALIASTSLLLTVFGLVMILSASSANAVDRAGPVRDRADAGARRRIGIPLMFLMSRFPVVLEAHGLAGPDRRGRPQMLVYTPLGVENDGNTNWLRIAAGGAALRVHQARPGRLGGVHPVAQAVAAGAVEARLHPLLPVGFLAIGSVSAAGTSAPR